MVPLITQEDEDFIDVDFLGNDSVTKAKIPKRILVEEGLMADEKVWSRPFVFEPLRSITKAELWARYVIPLGIRKLPLERIEFDPSEIREWGVG